VLAELLKEQHLTPALIEDAGLVAGGVGSRFAQETVDIANDVRNGSPLGYALQYGRGSSFDSFFGKLIEATDSRAQLSTLLIRMSS
jgi:hypothetical protein